MAGWRWQLRSGRTSTCRGFCSGRPSGSLRRVEDCQLPASSWERGAAAQPEDGHSEGSEAGQTDRGVCMTESERHKRHIFHTHTQEFQDHTWNDIEVGRCGATNGAIGAGRIGVFELPFGICTLLTARSVPQSCLGDSGDGGGWRL